ncbi:MAG TPA: sigma-70 family RNA polymerase sigma factor [Acidimicrobiales bacterium]|nr:sigma-70 family RNA polymerase sigma factor [Acidimicrobiales bacterium]
MTAASETTALIEAHLPLVRHVVLQVAGHFPRHVDRQELARAGSLGLVEAAQRYDASRGVPFDRFAARRIRGAILDAVRAVDWAPRSVRALGRELEAVEQELANRNGSQPSRDEVASAMGIDSSDLSALRDRVYRSVVLALEHAVAGDDGEAMVLGDVLADRTAVEPEESLETRELLGYLRDAISLLPERHRAVIVGYFLENRTSLDLADELQVTESRISQVRSEALEMLRAGIDAQYTPAPEQPAVGRSARRRAQYASAIGDASPWRDRLVASA